MAMLAEPKRKQKLSVDPRNKAWISDGCTFGQKLMKKMGWEEGRGLGRNEDGSTSSIKVAVKNNALGLGFSQQHDDNWISHQGDFNDLLSSLNQDHSTTEDLQTPSVPQNLQEKSKKAKRYKKFTRGKDLSSRSTSDMNCIMGVRSNSGTPKDRSRDQSRDQSGIDSAAELDGDAEGVTRVGFGFASTTLQQNPSVLDGSFGVQTTTSSSSIQEYFAQKMKELKRKQNEEAVSHSNTVVVGNSERINAESMETGKTSVLDSEDVMHQMDRKKKKSKRKRREKLEVSVEEENGPNSSQDGDCGKSNDKSLDQSHDLAGGNESPSLKGEINGGKMKKKKRKKQTSVLECGDGDSVDVGEIETAKKKKRKKENPKDRT